VIYSSKGIENLRNNSVIVYLKLGCQEVIKRIGSSRKLAREKSQSLLELYNERTPLYEKYADVVVECEGKDPYRIADEIMAGR
jgi:shikimate kinase